MYPKISLFEWIWLFQIWKALIKLKLLDFWILGKSFYSKLANNYECNGGIKWPKYQWHSQESVNFRSKSFIWKLPWFMTINSLAKIFLGPQSRIEVGGNSVWILAFVVKSGLWKNWLFVISDEKIHLQYDISMTIN